jgi:PAS domain S-box-containing protein
VRKENRRITREQGSVGAAEVEFKRKDGSTFIGLINSAVVRDEEGEVQYYDGAVADITERKQAERALREERNRLQTLFESLPTPVVRCEKREQGTLITAVNPAFEEVFGVEASAARGKDIDALLVPEEKKEEAREIGRQALKEGIQKAEVRRKAAGGLRDFQLQVAAQHRETAPPETRDITEQKEQEQELRRSQKRWQRLVERLQDGIHITVDEEIQYVNPAGAQVLGPRSRMR